MSDLATLLATVHGRVQGVGFRYFVLRKARILGLTGYVRNLRGGRAVEVLAAGERVRLEELLSQLKIGPSKARVDGVDTEWSEHTASYRDFEVAF